MTDADDSSISDESILYQGTWLAFDDASRITLTSQIEEQRLEYSILLAKLQNEITDTNVQNTKLLARAAQNDLTIQALQASNDEMVNEIAELSEDIESSKITEINRRAKEAQELARKQWKINQLEWLKNNPRNKGTIALAANNLQQYSIP
jgi:hypothetical protein